MTTSPNRFLDRRIGNHDCETEAGCCSTCQTHDGCSCDASGAPDLDVLAGLLAEARVDWPWYDENDLAEVLESINDIGDNAAADARFITAMSPEVVAALIAAARERDALATEVESLRSSHTSMAARRDFFRESSEEAHARLEDAERDLDEARAALGRVETLAVAYSEALDTHAGPAGQQVLPQVIRDLRAALAPTPGAEQEGGEPDALSRVLTLADEWEKHAEEDIQGCDDNMACSVCVLGEAAQRIRRAATKGGE